MSFMDPKNFENYSFIAVIILVVVGINVGLYGLIGHDCIQTLFGYTIGRLLCLLIGVVAGFEAYLIYFKHFAKKPPTAI